MAKSKSRKTIRREAFGGVEPGFEPRPKRGRGGRNEHGEYEPLDEERPNLGRIIESGLTMLMPFIVERIVASATAPERHEPAAQAFPNAPIYRDVRATPLSDLVLARCEAAPPRRSPLCGERYVPRRWINCPYCGLVLQAPVQ